MEFGRRMKEVSTLSPADAASKSIRSVYAGLVDPKLIMKWVASPATAPGRKVSSPWPDRIEVKTSAVRDGTFAIVEGVLIERSSSGDTSSAPVRMALGYTNTGWLITAYSPDNGDQAGEAVAIVKQYYAAIARRDFKSAYEHWETPTQSLDAFIDGFADTAAVRIETGLPSRIEGAAGSRYVDVPVTIVATTKAGQVQNFTGTYTLRRSVVDGATEAQHAWRIYRASIRRT
jgi:hypothetical protein